MSSFQGEKKKKRNLSSKWGPPVAHAGVFIAQVVCQVSIRGISFLAFFSLVQQTTIGLENIVDFQKLFESSSVFKRSCEATNYVREIRSWARSNSSDA